MHTLGPDQPEDRRAKIFNRALAWQTEQGEAMISYEVAPRHAEMIIGELTLQNSTPLNIFVVKDEAALDEPLQSELLEVCDATNYKSFAARVNYLVAGGPGIQLACKELSFPMSIPRAHAWDNLTRFGNS